MLDRGNAIGSGTLGHYAITSDSTVETFRSTRAVLPDGFGTESADVSRALEEHKGALGVPLKKVGAYLERIGEVLASPPSLAA